MTFIASLKGRLNAPPSAVQARRKSPRHRAETVGLRQTNPEHFNLILSYCQAATNYPEFVAMSEQHKPAASR